MKNSKFPSQLITRSWSWTVWAKSSAVFQNISLSEKKVLYFPHSKGYSRNITSASPRDSCSEKKLPDGANPLHLKDFLMQIEAFSVSFSIYYTLMILNSMSKIINCIPKYFFIWKKVLYIPHSKGYSWNIISASLRDSCS